MAEQRNVTGSSHRDSAARVEPNEPRLGYDVEDRLVHHEPKNFSEAVNIEGNKTRGPLQESLTESRDGIDEVIMMNCKSYNYDERQGGYLLDGRPTGYKLPDTFVFKEEEMPLIAKMFQFRSYLDLQVARKAEIGSSEDKSFIWPDSSPLFDDLY